LGMYHHERGSSPPSDTTHFPILFAFRCECLRADRHVGPEFVLSGQVGDLEPELFVDGCLHRWLGVVDDVVQIAEAGDQGPDVVIGELVPLENRIRLVTCESS
jgi:hypothetical protein